MTDTQQIQIQIHLLKWIRYHGERSLEQVRKILKILIKRFSIEGEKIDRYCLYYFCYHLCRYGFIELIPNKKVHISDSVALFSEKHKRCACINLPGNIINRALDHFKNVDTDEFQVVRFYAEKDEIELFFRKFGIVTQSDKISHVLKSIPAISDVIFGQDRSIIDFNIDFQKRCFRNYGWEKNHDKGNGLYKVCESDASRRYFFFNGDWFLIPEYPPDYSDIASCYQSILENRCFLRYDKENEEIHLEGCYLPIVIDRLLRIPSYPDKNGVIKKNHITIYKNIEYSVYSELDRIFCKSIKG